MALLETCALERNERLRSDRQERCFDRTGAVARTDANTGFGWRDRLPRVVGPQRFHFAFTPQYRLAALTFGVTPSTAWVELDARDFKARFGPWRLGTPIANIKHVAITGPYRFVKTAGPARLAITDRGLTFATNGDRGVLMSFHTPVRGLDPLGLIHHPELTVTVAEVDEFATLLEALRLSAALAET
jgi:hypothetical protein